METSLQEGLHDRGGAVQSESRAASAPHIRSQEFLEPFVRSPAHAWDELQIAPGGNLSPSYIVFQRLTDIVGALSVGLLAAPVIGLTFVTLLVTARGRPLFSQERVGHCGRRFRMYKFRSMRLNAHTQQHLVDNELDGPVFKNRRDPRITRIGRLLRMTSIDELPQLWNVLRGDMSLVGPRPLPTHEIAKCTPRQLQRLAVNPGLTCKWQVSGRSDIGFEEWIEMDLWYVRHQSVRTDLSLLLRTPWCVLTGRGAY